jgi:hypothetical protein
MSWDDGKAPGGVGIDRVCLNKGHPQVTKGPVSRLGYESDVYIEIQTCRVETLHMLCTEGMEVRTR